MQRVRIGRASLLIGVASVAMVSAVAVPSAEASPTTHAVQMIYSVSATPIPASRSLHDAVAAQSDVSPAIVRPDSVASGYTLVGNKSTDYIYNSSKFYMDAERCTDGECVQLAQVYAQVRENVQGGSSKRWLLTENAGTVDNPGGLSWHYTAIYYCAVNVSGSADHYCGNGASASGTEAPMTPGEAVYKTFEKVSGNIVYPMVGITVHWSTGGSYIAKFREWDTCNKATTTKLCASSGTGN